jgi:hypothetical protein
MAEVNLNSEDRRIIYDRLSRLNRSFAFIVHNLYKLEQHGIFKLLWLRELRGLTKELQSEINFKLLETLHSREAEDWYRLGKVRIAQEKILKVTK